MDAEKAIRARRSIRNYAARLPGKVEIDDLKDLIAAAPRLIPGIPLRFEIVESPETVALLLRGMLGSYGKIDSPCCLAAITHDVPGCLENLGYVGELLVLELQERGLSTCWVGGTFDRSAAQKLFGVRPPESLVCLIPFGYAEPGRKDPLRALAGSDRKKGGEKLFSAHSWGQLLSGAEIPFQGAELVAELCALAPSAMNRQPVRCVLSPDRARVYCQRLSGSGALDAGIFMAHLALALELCGKKPVWENGSAVASLPGVPASYRGLGAFAF